MKINLFEGRFGAQCDIESVFMTDICEMVVKICLRNQKVGC